MRSIPASIDLSVSVNLKDLPEKARLFKPAFEMEHSRTLATEEAEINGIVSFFENCNDDYKVLHDFHVIFNDNHLIIHDFYELLKQCQQHFSV